MTHGNAVKPFVVDRFEVDHPHDLLKMDAGVPSFATKTPYRPHRHRPLPPVFSDVLAEIAKAPNVTDIFINGNGTIWVDRGNGTHRHNCGFDEPAVRELALSLISAGGRHIDEANPCVDVRLTGGIRVHAVLPPVSTMGTTISIRFPGIRKHTLHSLSTNGMFTTNTVEHLKNAVRRRENFLITGAGGSGKTTLLAALLSEASSTERIVTIEDVAELNIDHPHVVSLEARQANVEGAGRIDLERLLREALRMRPDRLVLGECRGAEARELLAALNTGHNGGAGTLHANSLHDVPARLEALGALAHMTPEAIARQTVSAIKLVLHVERINGIRRLMQWGRFRLDSYGRLAIEEYGELAPAVTPQSER